MAVFVSEFETNPAEAATVWYDGGNILKLKLGSFESNFTSRARYSTV